MTTPTEYPDAETIMVALVDIYAAAFERVFDGALDDLKSVAVAGTVTREELDDAKQQASVTALLTTLSISMAALSRGKTAELTMFMEAAAAAAKKGR